MNHRKLCQRELVQKKKKNFHLQLLGETWKKKKPTLISMFELDRINDILRESQ